MLDARFMDKVTPEPNSGCWLWVARVNEDGYGTFCVRGKMKRAHRVAYEATKGPIPPGMEIDHLCRVRCCVNPQHLEAVTPRENVMRSAGIASRNAQKTHCMRGHMLTGDNLYVPPGASRRRCHECMRHHAHRQYVMRRAK